MRSILNKKVNYNTIRICVALWLRDEEITVLKLSETIKVPKQNIYNFLNGFNDSCEILLRIVKIGFKIENYIDVLNLETELRING